jgi:hypothetical protein
LVCSAVALLSDLSDLCGVRVDIYRRPLLFEYTRPQRTQRRASHAEIAKVFLLTFVLFGSAWRSSWSSSCSSWFSSWFSSCHRLRSASESWKAQILTAEATEDAEQSISHRGEHLTRRSPRFFFLPSWHSALLGVLRGVLRGLLRVLRGFLRATACALLQSRGKLKSSPQRPQRTQRRASHAEIAKVFLLTFVAFGSAWCSSWSSSCSSCSSWFSS